MKKFGKLLNDNRIRNFILISGLAAIALIFLSTFISFDGNGTSGSSVSDYRLELQQSITDMLSEVEGVGEVKVLLTIENSSEGVYLDNNSTKTKEIEPVIRGAVVVCDGGDDPVVVGRINDAVTKALNISSAKVCVTKLSK